MIALASLAELETQYLITVRLKFIESREDMEKMMLEVKKMLLGFRNYVASKSG
ncbi:four helix bundle protein [Pseudotamlana carrageenivorans]|uniref:four helix bundle protein n=1 Tax=Pseudotamlana carrageenivorans TaxID=2069432 RepID=UPI0024110D7D|nr:four helix bundle protein [Tamlana carrageenivorans]